MIIFHVSKHKKFLHALKKSDYCTYIEYICIEYDIIKTPHYSSEICFGVQNIEKNVF